jgi:molybdopterin-guanine dinucleotide biosynthesis protein A
VILPRQEIAPGMGSIAVFKDTDEEHDGPVSAVAAGMKQMKKAPAKKEAPKKAKKRTRR